MGDDYSWIRDRKTFPLHLHWDGSIPAESLFHMAEERGADLLMPSFDISNRLISYFPSSSRRVDSPAMLTEFIHALGKYKITDVFGMFTQFMQTSKDFEDLALAQCRYLKTQNSPYAEVRFAPEYHTRAGLSIEDVIRCAVDGFQKGHEATGVDARLIICIDRGSAPDLGVAVADAAIAVNKDYPGMVLGIDLACWEVGNPPEKHYPAFRQTFDTPLKRTVHAGEMCDESTNMRNIWTAIHCLRADAISHAIPLHKDPDSIYYMREKNIRLESNPVCNEFFFRKDVHDDLRLDRLLSQGVLVTVNPDDPAMIPGGHMHDNLIRLAGLYGPEIVDKLIKNSIISAWGLSDEKKVLYIKELG